MIRPYFLLSTAVSALVAVPADVSRRLRERRARRELRIRVRTYIRGRRA
ncbi:MAG: hypothetical protein AB1941_10070 [Gemmatimonadota bacterium]